MQNAFSQEELYTVGPHFKGAYFMDYFCNFAIWVTWNLKVVSNYQYDTRKINRIWMCN